MRHNAEVSGAGTASAGLPSYASATTTENEMDHLIDDSDRLKPCPFCGAEAEIITLEGETDDPSIGAQCVQCTSSACGAASGLIYPLMDDVTDLLRERWNKRHNAK
jgi:hypothetical protein